MFFENNCLLPIVSLSFRFFCASTLENGNSLKRLLLHWNDEKNETLAHTLLSNKKKTNDIETKERNEKNRNSSEVIARFDPVIHFNLIYFKLIWWIHEAIIKQIHFQVAYIIHGYDDCIFYRLTAHVSIARSRCAKKKAIQKNNGKKEQRNWKRK